MEAFNFHELDNYILSAMRGLTLVLLLLAAYSAPTAPWRPGRTGWLLGQLSRGGYVLLFLSYAFIIWKSNGGVLSFPAVAIHLGIWLICIAQIARRGMWVNHGKIT